MTFFNNIKSRIENALNQRSVAWRTQTLTRVIIGGFVILGLIYALAFTVDFVTKRDLQNLLSFERAVKSAELNYIQARRDEKNFYLPIKSSKARYLKEHANEIIEFDRDLQTVSDLAPNDETHKKATELRVAIKQYNEKFLLSVDKITRAGYNEKTGQHKVMLEAIEALEAALPANATIIKVEKLNLRTIEKDYIQREDKQYADAHVAARAEFLAALNKTPNIDLPAMTALFNQYTQAFDAFAEARAASRIALEEANVTSNTTEDLVSELQTAAHIAINETTEKDNLIAAIAAGVFTGLIFLIGLILITLISIIARGIRQPVAHLQATINQLAEDETVRTQMDQPDEFGELGRAFDRLMDERIAVQKAIIDENDKLNDAVLDLLQAVAILARKDLTHKVPVTEDVTGPVADALNLLTSETAKVLQRVSDLSADVTEASMQVKAQSEQVILVAQKEQDDVNQTAQALTTAAESMTKIAAVARVANKSAEQAILTTRQAMDTVNTTVLGINSTRETIRETEKRIKRLGERSQEISLAVNLINSIAERTHILALNASMHAASAGEAGRGFAVVADEVQRLSESAQQSTQQITSLVHNIQADTAETMNVMNLAIEQVVADSRLAEQAGQQMKVTEQNTAHLVKAVQQIALASEAQVKINRELVSRAADIRASSQYTNEKLQEQALQTTRLVEYARGLLAAVRVFKLPG